MRRQGIAAAIDRAPAAKRRDPGEPTGCDAAGRLRRDATASLLWAVCHPEPEPAAIAMLSSLADGERAATAAVAHRIGPLLWRALVQAGTAGALQEDTAAWLDQVATVYRLQAQVLLPQATALAIGPLTGAGLEPVVLKGPALAARYPEVGLRPMDDIDLLLPKAQHRRALRLLGDAGWQPVRAAGRARYDTVLSHREVPGLALELHYGFEAWYERATALEPEAVWRRRVPADCLGTAAFVPAPEDEVVVLAAHAGKPYHCFERMIWVADLAVAVHDASRGGRELDWDRVAHRATEARCGTTVAVALHQARRAGAVVPTGVLDPPCAGWRGRALERLLALDWPLAAGAPDSTFYLRFALVDSSWRRLALLAGAAHGMPVAAKVTWPAVALWRALRRLRVLAEPPPPP